MYDDWPETTKVLSAHLRNLRGGAPDVMKAFWHKADITAVLIYVRFWG